MFLSEQCDGNKTNIKRVLTLSLSKQIVKIEIKNLVRVCFHNKFNS